MFFDPNPRKRTRGELTVSNDLRGKSRAAANFWEGGRPLGRVGHAREERGEESPSAGESRPPVPGPSSWDGVTPSQLHISRGA